MCFYGVMGVYITPDLIVGTVLSAFFYGFWCAGFWTVKQGCNLCSCTDRLTACTELRTDLLSAPSPKGAAVAGTRPSRRQITSES